VLVLNGAALASARPPLVPYEASQRPPASNQRKGTGTVIIPGRWGRGFSKRPKPVMALHPFVISY
jgi:hypothetical protein